MIVVATTYKGTIRAKYLHIIAHVVSIKIYNVTYKKNPIMTEELPS